MERDVAIDIARGIGIILVIFAHTLESKLTEVIYYFHMPLFFFLSGMALYYSYKEDISFKEYFIKKFKSILIPYFVFGIVTFFYWILIERKLRAQEDISIFNTFINIFTVRINENSHVFNVVLWFLPCLFVAQILFYFVIKYKVKIQIGIYIILLILGYVLSTSNIYLPFAFETALIGLFFIGMGYLFLLYKSRIALSLNNMKLAILLLISIGVLIFCFVCNNHVDMRIHIYSNLILFLLGAIAGIYIILFLSYNIGNIKLMKNCLSFLGRNSLIIMCCHEPIKRIIIKLCSVITRTDISMIRGGIIWSMIVTLIIIAVLIPVIFAINKYLPFIIGKKYSRTICSKEN